MNLHNAIRCYPPYKTKIIPEASSSSNSSFLQSVRRYCIFYHSSRGFVDMLCRRKDVMVAWSEYQQYHPLCQFRVNSSGIVWCEAPNKYHYNICIWRKTRWVGPIFNYDMTMTASAQLLTHLLTASFLAKQPRRFFEMSFLKNLW